MGLLSWGLLKGILGVLTRAQFGPKSPGRGNWRSSDNESLPGNAGFMGALVTLITYSLAAIPP